MTSLEVKVHSKRGERFGLYRYVLIIFMICFVVYTFWRNYSRQHLFHSDFSVIMTNFDAVRKLRKNMVIQE